MTKAASLIFSKVFEGAGIRRGLATVLAFTCASFFIPTPAIADQAAWNHNIRYFNSNSECMRQVRSAMRRYDSNPDFWWESSDAFWMQSGDFYITSVCSGGTLHFLHVHRVGNRGFEPINVVRQITRNLD